MTKTLMVTALCKAYSDVVAIDGISFDVNHNEIVGLLGPNGAGKTTTINIVLGVLEPAEGYVLIEGEDIGKHRVNALEKTNFAAHYTPLPGNLTVRQNLKVFGLLYNVVNLSRQIDELLERFALGRYRDVKCGLLSSGEQARVSLAKAM